MKKLSFMLLCLILVGCGTPAGYKFSMLSPTADRNMSFSDKYIDIQFAMRQAYLIGVGGGMKTYKTYNGVSFTLTNKTNDVITIDWNKISFKDMSGSSGNAVMHQGVKYNECSSPKSSSTIPPKGRITDVIIPCYGVKYENGWKVSILLSARKHPDVKFGVFMPIQIGEKNVNYDFSFRGLLDEAK